jgi:hypothetical protein
MAEASGELEGPDFAKGCKLDELGDGKMVLGHALGEAILVARQGDRLFAIGATSSVGRRQYLSAGRTARFKQK